MTKLGRNIITLFLFIFFFHSYSQKTCPNCGFLKLPYPLSTNPNCGNPDYTLRCDPQSHKLYFDTLNRSSHLVIRIIPLIQRLILQPSPWLPNTCISQDTLTSEGIWLNQTLPFNITSSNTIFLYNCSPRLFVSPLNCTPSSLCHKYLENSKHFDPKSQSECASGPRPCCTFLAGGMPSAYTIRLHNSGCRAFRSILHLNTRKQADQWEEGLEIQWAPPPEPICSSRADCSGFSTCSSIAKNGVFRCFCNKGYSWDHAEGTCLRSKKMEKSSNLSFGLKVSFSVAAFFVIAAVLGVVMLRKCSRRFSYTVKLAKAREETLRVSNGGKSARMYSLREMKKATDNFSKIRFLGSGGFGEVYKGNLQDGTIVAIKLAKVGDIKSTEQVLNEVGILSQVNHKHLVKLLGCCIEAEQPLMIYEYVSNGTLYDHLHGKFSSFLNWETRLRIALQTAEALAYLHSAAYNPVYHRDVKSSNILLDDEFNAKVADFGLSRLASPGLSHVSTCAQGTLGYLDPEYYRNYHLTDKSDVYSFGVVLLELLTSLKVIDFSRECDNINLVFYVSERVGGGGSILDVVDQRLAGEGRFGHTVKSLETFREIALACLKEKKEDRPCMKDVVGELQCVINMAFENEGTNVITEINDP